MTADDIWGHEYIDINGKSYDERSKPDQFSWMIHLYYKENDGHAFIRNGPQRRICLKINPLVELEEASQAFKNYRCAKHSFDRRTAKDVFSELENMIKSGNRDSEINTTD